MNVYVYQDQALLEGYPAPLLDEVSLTYARDKSDAPTQVDAMVINGKSMDNFWWYFITDGIFFKYHSTLKRNIPPMNITSSRHQDNFLRPSDDSDAVPAGISAMAIKIEDPNKPLQRLFHMFAGSSYYQVKVDIQPNADHEESVWRHMGEMKTPCNV